MPKNRLFFFRQNQPGSPEENQKRNEQPANAQSGVSSSFLRVNKTPNEYFDRVNSNKAVNPYKYGPNLFFQNEHQSYSAVYLKVLLSFFKKLSFVIVITFCVLLF